MAARVRAVLADPVRAEPGTVTAGPGAAWLPDDADGLWPVPTTWPGEVAHPVPPHEAVALASVEPGVSGLGRHRPSESAFSAASIASRLRIDSGRRGAVALGVVVLLAAVITAWWVFLGRPHATAVPVTTGSAVPSSVAPSRTGSATSGVVVDVVGRVRRPGVYRLAAGSRVADAVRAAGGTSPGVDLSSTNLARMLVDGEQIPIGTAGATPPTAPASGPAGSGATGLVDLNTSTAEQLDALPGVGPVLAQHILDWRAAHGRFDSVDQLRDVSGIGPSKYADLRPLVSV